MFRKNHKIYQNKIEEGIFRLEAFSLDTLRTIKGRLSEDPGKYLEKYAKEIKEFNAIGNLLSSDWERLTIASGHRDPDKVMERLGVMLPKEILEWKDICEKLSLITEIYDMLSKMRDMTQDTACMELIQDEVLPDLTRQLAEVKKMQGDVNKVDEKELVDLCERKAFLLAQKDDMLDHVKKLNKDMTLYDTYNRAIGDIYNSIMLAQANPKNIKHAYDWLHIVCIQVIMQSSTDPTSKQSLDTTYKIIQTLDSSECKGLKIQEKAFMLVKAIYADYEYLHISFNPTDKHKTFTQFLNAQQNNHDVARKLGLMLKVMLAAYPDSLPGVLKEKIQALALGELKNPYKDFLAHVELPSSMSSSSSVLKR